MAGSGEKGPARAQRNKKCEAVRRAGDSWHTLARFRAGLRTRAVWVDSAVERAKTGAAPEERICLAFAPDADARTQDAVEVGAGGHAAK